MRSQKYLLQVLYYIFAGMALINFLYCTYENSLSSKK